MKTKKILILSLILLFTITNLNNTSFGENKDNYIYINNINKKDIEIKIDNIEILNKEIKLNEVFQKYAIVTMKIRNLGLDYMELSNINLYIYDGSKKLPVFIQSEKGCFGFIGDLYSGEEKEIKIGIVLPNKPCKLKFVFENLSDIKKEKFIKLIKI